MKITRREYMKANAVAAAAAAAGMAVPAAAQNVVTDAHQTQLTWRPRTGVSSPHTAM